MLKLLVSGKPSKFRMLEKPTANGATAMFLLEETRFAGGGMYKVLWECYVQPHKVKWASKMTEKPYTIVVEADEFYVLGGDDPQKGITRYMMRVTEIHGL